MASGWGLHGNVSRCFPFWRDFEDCCYKYQQESREFCWREREDYVECLHHGKEFERVRLIQQEYDKQFKWSKKLRQEEEAAAHAAMEAAAKAARNLPASPPPPTTTTITSNKEVKDNSSGGGATN